jgi:predicted 2-oxoglutarate/Fe(II)-dependent dioxygenase YbiX
VAPGHLNVLLQSMMRKAGERALLLQLNPSIRDLRARAPDSPEIQTLVFLLPQFTLRMWAASKARQ